MTNMRADILRFTFHNFSIVYRVVRLVQFILSAASDNKKISCRALSLHYFIYITYALYIFYVFFSMGSESDQAPEHDDVDEAEEKELLIAGCGSSSKVSHHIPSHIYILHITFSCFSALGADMYDDGFTNITNVDISEVVVNYMRSKGSQLFVPLFLSLNSKALLVAGKYSNREHMEFTMMDVSFTLKQAA